ncbi:hypothetical protein AVEN_261265-1 [Araneus ventricosus]|uniref:Tesmin/TSO1-like CXC domain-containing protein n=1 Tax=Araneus ventricosus TaxID=182803 RepID=A0A4Y2HVV4_ARAVE|nr:hypothetical protein AVEN_261265-1 [Araneus ventricosus]
MFHEETVLQYTKEKLLANECNKKRFIELLKKVLQKANICVQQAVEDADLTIVNSAISVAPQYDYVCVVGEDIDLLVLLTALASTHSNVFSKSVEEGKRQTVITQPHHLIINSRMNFCLFMLSVVVISHQHCLAKAAFIRNQRRIQHQSPSFNAFPVLAKKGCANACGCRKAGLHCSLLCKHCIGQSCENPMPVILDNESEEGDAPAPIDMVDEQLECEDIEARCTLADLVVGSNKCQSDTEAINDFRGMENSWAVPTHLLQSEGVANDLSDTIASDFPLESERKLDVFEYVATNWAVHT